MKKPIKSDYHHREAFMHLILKKHILLLFAAFIVAACGSNRSEADYIDPRDTIQVPEGLTGEDSIAYIENEIYQSPITADQLLSLAEVHSLEEMLYYYNNEEEASKYPENAENYFATHRDSCAMRFANRFMRMYYLVNSNGDAEDMLQLVSAVNAIRDTFHAEMPDVPRDSILGEIERVINKFSALSQIEMNEQSYIDAAVEYYRTIEAYNLWLKAVPSQYKALAKEEYVAWCALNEARYTFWRHVSFRQEWYSMKPMEFEYYYAVLAQNRRAELVIERDIVLQGKVYRQLGRTVTTQQWENWITKSSVPEDIDLLNEMEELGCDFIPDEATVTECVDLIRTTFQRWLKARQAFAAALPKAQGTSYDNLTADIHARLIGTLPTLVPMPEF